MLQPLCSLPPVLVRAKFEARWEGDGRGTGTAVGGVTTGGELPTPTVLATCLENIQIACVICKPLSHPGGSYISCHYLGGPPIIVSCNNQLQRLVPRAEKPRLAPFFFFFQTLDSPLPFPLDKEWTECKAKGVKNGPEWLNPTKKVIILDKIKKKTQTIQRKMLKKNRVGWSW